MSKLINQNNLDKLAKALDARSKAAIKSSVAEESARATAAELTLREDIDLTQSMFGGKSIQYITQSQYNSLSDAEKNDESIAYFITDAEDLSHKHGNKELLDKIGARTITIGSKGKTFDGSENISWTLDDIGAAPKSHSHDDKYYTESEINTKLSDLQTSLNSAINTETNRATAAETSLQTAINGKADKSHGNHVPNTQTANNAIFLRNDNTWAAVTPSNIGAAEEDHGTHVVYSTTTPKGNGTASAGSESKVARGDHVHPLQTTISGNAGSADKLSTSRTITVGNKSNDFDGSGNITYTLADIGAAAEGHSHDGRYCTESEVDIKIANLQSEIDEDVLVETDRAKAAEEALQAAIDKKSASGHVHDDRYYTESEINTKISNLQSEIDSDVKVEADRAKAAEAALQSAIDGKSASGHTHDDRYFTETEVTNKLAGKSDVGHAHDDKYYTETEIDAKVTSLNTAISGKANASHGNHVPTTQTAANNVFLRNDNTWATVTPDNIGAAKSSHGTHVTWATNAPKANGEASVGSVSRVAREDHIHPLQESVEKLTTARTITIGSHSETFDGTDNITYTLENIGASAEGHTHDGRYYTESEINTKVTNLQAEIDADVKTEADRAKAAEATLQANIDKKANASHGNHVPATETANNAKFLRNDNTWATVTPTNIGAAVEGHAHDGRYYTETEIDSKITTLNTAINGKANSSHGNHVPETQPASNKVFLRNDNTWATITPDNIGAANASHGTHVTYATATPSANGTASVGTSSKVAREDHVHPIQTSVSGNAGTATTLATARTITIGNKGIEFDGSKNITYSLTDIGASAEGHTHDGRYYTESEINTKITSLQSEIDADVKVEADRAKEAEAALQAAIDGKSASSHTHDDRYFTETEVTNKLAGKSDTGHTHDDRYYTETEINSKISTINTSIATAKSDAQAYADQKIAALVDSAPEAMNTLNELATAISNHQGVYDAYVEEVTSKLAGKSDTGHTHNYAGSSSVGGAATSANKVNTNLVVKLNSGSTEGTNLFTFNGSAAKTINITPSSIGAAASSHGTHVDYSTTTPKANGTATVGSESTVARGDHVHPLQTSVSGNAGTATKLASAKNIQIGNKTNSFDGSANISYTLADIGALPSAGGTATGAITVDLNGSGAGFMVKNGTSRTMVFASQNKGEYIFGGSNDDTVQVKDFIRIGSSTLKYETGGNVYNIYHTGNKPSLDDLGAAAKSHGTHVTYASATPLAASGSGAIGSSSKVAREDHVHPLQTTISGNSGSSDKWSTARTLTIGNKGQSVDGTANVTWTLSEIGAAPTSHNHTSLTGVTSIAFAADSSDTASITTTASNSATYFDFNLSDDPGQDDQWRWRFTPSGGTIFNAMVLDATSTTAAKLTVTGDVTATSFTENGTALSNKYAAKSHGTHVGDAYATAVPLANGTASMGSSSKIAREDHVHPLQTSVSGNAGTATTLQTARTINGTSFNGSANITTSTWGSARNVSIADSSATNTGTAVSVDGSGNVTLKLPATIKATLTGNASTATKLETARTINGTTFNGSDNITTANWGTARNIYIADSDATNTGAAVSVNGSGNATLKLPATIKATLSGNASTATKLAATKTINGTAFDGSGNITTANWGTARTLTIGNKGQSVNGSGNVSWTLSDIGAAPIEHDHQHLLGEDLTSKTLTLNDLNLSSGTPKFKVYFCPTDGGGSSITGRPNDNSKQAFNLIVESLRWASTTDYITKQTYTQGSQKAVYIRYCTSGTWTAWEKVYTSAQKPTPSDIGAAASSHGTHVDYETSTPKANGTAAVGSSTKVSRGDHVHPLQTTVSGNAGTATKLQTTRSITIGNKSNNFDGSANITYTISDIGAAPASHTHNYAGSSSAGGAANSVKTNLIVKLNGGATEGTDLFTFNGSTAKTINITPASIGAATATGHGTHVTYATNAPKVAASTASVGSEATVARGDHVHPVQTSVSGNAGTATKLATARNITIGNKSNSFDGSAAISFTLAEIGASPLQKTVVSKSVSSGTLTLSTDRYQKATLTTGNTIALPSVSNFCEINLFVKDCSLSSINLPDNCKWRVDPNLQTGTSYIFTFIYTTQEWLAEAKIFS